MALPNLAQQNSSRVPPSLNQRRIFANESKNMDQILGSNVAKDYQKLDTFPKRRLNDQFSSGQQQPILVTNSLNYTDGLVGNKYNGYGPGPGMEKQNSLLELRPSSIDRFNKAIGPDFNTLNGINSATNGGGGGGGNGSTNNKREFLKKNNLMSQDGPMDYDKYGSLERLVSQLSDQMTSLERMFMTEIKRNKTTTDIEQTAVSRLENSLKLYEENFVLSNSDLLNKINILESRLNREEKVKIDLRERLSASEQNQKELMTYFKNIQDQENQELLQMRAILQEKLTEDQASLVKEREKSKALFNEVVRLGEQQERSNEIIQTLNLQLETKFSTIDSKLTTYERNVMGVMVKGESGLTNIQEWNDKTDKKIQMLESNLYTLGREQLKDKDTISKLEILNKKLTEDVSQLLTSLHSDYQTRLESRVSELVNRIMMEHEERVKIQEEFKNQMQIKEQLSNEKANYEREEMRDKYATMDALVKAEFQRKDEAIKTLHNLLETQVRLLQSNIKAEELARNQFETFVRAEMLKFQENFKKELELFKQTVSTTTEKLTEMIKIEIDTRLTSDIELKNHIALISTNLTNDIDILKDGVEKQNRKFATDIKEIALESAERANQVSRYIDQEILKLNEGYISKYDKLKGIFSKFGEQFKTHLMNTENFRKETLAKVQEIENHIEVVREELTNMIKSNQQNNENSLKDERILTENRITMQIKVIDDKANKLKDELDNDVNILKQAIDNNRTIYMNKIQKLMDSYQVYHKNNTENTTKVLNELDNIRTNLLNLQNQIMTANAQFNDEISDVKANVDVRLLTEKVLLENAIDNLNQHVQTDLDNFDKDIEKINNGLHDMHGFVEQTILKTEEKFGEFGDKIADLFNKVSMIDENFLVYQEKAQNEADILFAHFTVDNLLIKDKNKLIFNELKALVESVTKLNLKSKSMQQNVGDFLMSLSTETNTLKNQLENIIPQMVENKIKFAFEKLKKDNQMTWESTLDYVKNDFRDTQGVVNHNVPAKTKFTQLTTQDDLIPKPLTIQDVVNQANNTSNPSHNTSMDPNQSKNPDSNHNIPIDANNNKSLDLNQNKPVDANQNQGPNNNDNNMKNRPNNQAQVGNTKK